MVGRPGGMGDRTRMRINYLQEKHLQWCLAVFLKKAYRKRNALVGFFMASGCQP